MKLVLRRILGILLIFTAIISLLLSLFFLVQIWRLRLPLTTQLVDNLNLLYDTCATAETSLTVMETTLINIQNTADTLQDTTASVAQSIHDTSLLVDSVSTLAGNDFPTTITNTQTAIASAQSSAIVIDNVLNALASIPLIGIDYNPPLPLNLALGQVSDSLSSIPVALEQIQADLDSTHTNLNRFEENVININQNIQVIIDDLSEAQEVITDYKTEVGLLKSRLEHSRSAAPDYVLQLALILTFVITWLSISQLGLLLQGLDLVAYANHPQVNPPSQD